MTSIMAAITEANARGTRYFGVRGDNYRPSVGQALDASYDWDYDNDCQSDRQLDGTCATGIGYLWFDGEDEDEMEIARALEAHRANYLYDYISIIGGGYANYGADEGELIIEGAEVVCIVN